MYFYLLYSGTLRFPELSVLTDRATKAGSKSSLLCYISLPDSTYFIAVRTLTSSETRINNFKNFCCYK